MIHYAALATAQSISGHRGLKMQKLLESLLQS
jgi:hypothetical protein